VSTSQIFTVPRLRPAILRPSGNHVTEFKEPNSLLNLATLRACLRSGRRCHSCRRSPPRLIRRDMISWTGGFLLPGDQLVMSRCSRSRESIAISCASNRPLGDSTTPDQTGSSRSINAASPDGLSSGFASGLKHASRRDTYDHLLEPRGLPVGGEGKLSFGVQ
jgi:hypothetical protein